MRKGFTLVELIIVIIIVGILAALGISQYTKVIEKGRAAEARTILGALRAAEVAEMNENGAYVGVVSLSVGAPTACVAGGVHYFSYTCNTDAASPGSCTATRCTGVLGKPPGIIAADVYTKTLDIAGTWTSSVGGY